MYIVQATNFKGFCLLRQRRRVGCCLKIFPTELQLWPSFPKKLQPGIFWPADPHSCSLRHSRSLPPPRFLLGPAGGSGRTEWRPLWAGCSGLARKVTSGGERRPRASITTTPSTTNTTHPPKHNTIPNHHCPTAIIPPSHTFSWRQYVSSGFGRL